MQRPQVRIIDNQQEITQQNVDVSQSEADFLLAKYGYKQSYTSQSQPSLPTNSQSFEDMVKQQENEKRRIEEDRARKMNIPRPVSFDSNNINYSQTKYSNLEIDNNQLGIKIQIVTDMKI
jgi:hypothetical protein